ncbi:MAG: hypothetical protein ACK5R4_06035 [Alphaproteobacteria bacterium]
MRVNGSRVAAIAEPLTVRLQKAAGWNFKTIALSVAALSVSFIGVFGAGIGVGALGASWAIDRYKNNVITNDKKKILADHYREQIATQLGIRPQEVNVKTLEMAARVNPMFANMLAKVKAEHANENRALTMGTVVGGAAASWIPGIGALSGVVSKGVQETVGHVTGSVAGGMAASFFNKDVLFTQDVAEHIDAKMKQGEPITAFDVMLLRIAQNEAFQAEIKKQSSKPFHKMNEAEQRVITASMPELYDAAERDAEAVNQGRMTPQDLLVVSPGAVQQQDVWASKIGGSRAPRGSFVQAVEASRATAMSPQRG